MLRKQLTHAAPERAAKFTTRGIAQRMYEAYLAALNSQ